MVHINLFNYWLTSVNLDETKRQYFFLIFNTNRASLLSPNFDWPAHGRMTMVEWTVILPFLYYCYYLPFRKCVRPPFLVVTKKRMPSNFSICLKPFSHIFSLSKNTISTSKVIAELLPLGFITRVNYCKFELYLFLKLHKWCVGVRFLRIYPFNNSLWWTSFG